MTVLSKSLRRINHVRCREAAVGTPYHQITVGVPKGPELKPIYVFQFKNLSDLSFRWPGTRILYNLKDC